VNSADLRQTAGVARASNKQKGFTVGIASKVAVITCASQGIGAALVTACRDRKYRVVATALSMKPLSGDDVVVVSGDIADRKTADHAISQGIARFGRIVTLVNNAGIFISKPSLSTPRQTTRRSWAAMSRASFTSRNSPSPRWRSTAAAISCRSRRALFTTPSPAYPPLWRR
jgi:NAD(P)-dependent dehydrogenase (short-subunit alcohol dehydrogenase family)